MSSPKSSDNPGGAGSHVGATMGEKIKGAAHVVHGAGEIIRGNAMDALDSLTGTQGRHPSPDYAEHGKEELEQGLDVFRSRSRSRSPEQKGGDETQHEGDTTRTMQTAGAGHEQDQPHYYGAGGPQNAEHRGAGAGAGLAREGAGGGQQRSTRAGQPGAVDERGVQSVPDQSSEGVRGSVFGQGGGQRATQQQYLGQGQGATRGASSCGTTGAGDTTHHRGDSEFAESEYERKGAQGGGYGGDPGRRQQSGVQGQEMQGVRDIPGVPGATTQSEVGAAR